MEVIIINVLLSIYSSSKWAKYRGMGDDEKMNKVLDEEAKIQNKTMENLDTQQRIYATQLETAKLKNEYWKLKLKNLKNAIENANSNVAPQ